MRTMTTGNGIRDNGSLLRLFIVSVHGSVNGLINVATGLEIARDLVVIASEALETQLRVLVGQQEATDAAHDAREERTGASQGSVQLTTYSMAVQWRELQVRSLSLSNDKEYHVPSE